MFGVWELGMRRGEVARRKPGPAAGNMIPVPKPPTHPLSSSSTRLEMDCLELSCQFSVRKVPMFVASTTGQRYSC